MYKEIKYVVIDVDGCLTDGIYQISSTFEITKSFYTRDFYGIEQLLRAGLEVAIITQSHDDVIVNQINRICNNSDFWKKCFFNKCKLHIFKANDDKKSMIDMLLREGDTWENVAYIGDAENDLECMKLAGVTGCPTDAIIEVIDEATYPSDFYGGKGAVYDFCKYLLAQKEKEMGNEDS